ncbi:MAG TPA: cupin fold metalloprotein, WbuC family [Prolixibacteraceae bacterium]|jgi:cupin fold WbuC family metalloprotein|nr:cupin fold metalloprotein, WbuC family [Prolixibacteraceae bacterium]
MKIISDQTLSGLSQKAVLLPRRRLNLNFHEELSDPMNRMLNAFEPGTYIQPHKHESPDKREVFIILRGSLVVAIFDESGQPTDFVLLDPRKGTHAIEIPPGCWHSILSLESGTVVYEIKDGPYVVTSDKNFAPWAPKEGDAPFGEYLNQLTRQFHAI